MEIRSMQRLDMDRVLVLWDAGCKEDVGYGLDDDAKKRVRRNLHEYLAHDQCECLVADDGYELVGFITFSLLGHPVQPGYAGEIEELYVDKLAERNEIQIELIRRAVTRLKQNGAGVITTKVAVDEPDTMQFWHRLGWSQDTANFSIYSNVPANPELQGVWDNFPV